MSFRFIDNAPFPKIEFNIRLPKNQVDLVDGAGKIAASIVNLEDEDKTDPVGKPMGAEMTQQDIARYCGVQPTQEEPKPTLFNCAPCKGTGGNEMGLCGACRGKGLLDAKRIAEINSFMGRR